MYPIAHTCFNRFVRVLGNDASRDVRSVLCANVTTSPCNANGFRLDVPTYETKEELAQAMTTVIDMEVCGFGME